MTVSPTQPFVSSGSSRASLAPAVQMRSFAGELIILDSAGGDYFALNEVGAGFVRALEEGCSVDESARRVHDAYDVAWEQLWSDLLQLFQELVSRKLIVPRTSFVAAVESSS